MSAAFICEIQKNQTHPRRTDVSQAVFGVPSGMSDLHTTHPAKIRQCARRAKVLSIGDRKIICQDPECEQLFLPERSVPMSDVSDLRAYTIQLAVLLEKHEAESLDDLSTSERAPLVPLYKKIKRVYERKRKDMLDRRRSLPLPIRRIGPVEADIEPETASQEVSPEPDLDADLDAFPGGEEVGYDAEGVHQVRAQVGL